MIQRAGRSVIRRSGWQQTARSTFDRLRSESPVNRKPRGLKRRLAFQSSGLMNLISPAALRRQKWKPASAILRCEPYLACLTAAAIAQNHRLNGQRCPWQRPAMQMPQSLGKRLSLHDIVACGQTPTTCFILGRTSVFTLTLKFCASTPWNKQNKIEIYSFD